MRCSSPISVAFGYQNVSPIKSGLLILWLKKVVVFMATKFIAGEASVLEELEIFEENMDADDYLKILRKKLPEMDRLYPDGYIWQQDGSGVHRAYIVQDFIEDEMPQTIDWPHILLIYHQ